MLRWRSSSPPPGATLLAAPPFPSRHQVLPREAPGPMFFWRQGENCCGVTLKSIKKWFPGTRCLEVLPSRCNSAAALFPASKFDFRWTASFKERTFLVSSVIIIIIIVIIIVIIIIIIIVIFSCGQFTFGARSGQTGAICESSNWSFVTAANWFKSSYPSSSPASCWCCQRWWCWCCSPRWVGAPPNWSFVVTPPFIFSNHQYLISI